MRRFSDRYQFSTLSELNVTPLLDLAFVLLIIFMITAPMLEKSVDLVVPSSKRAGHPVPPPDVVNISVNRNGVIALDGAATDLDSLPSLLAARRQSKPDTAAVVRAHFELPVQSLVDILDAVKAAGISKVGVVTTEQK